MPYPTDLVNNFGFLSIKILKLPFHVLDMDFCLRVSATVIVLPKNHPGSVLFWLLVKSPLWLLLFIYFIFSEIKMQNVQDDALLVQEICSFIHFIFNKWF